MRRLSNAASMDRAKHLMEFSGEMRMMVMMTMMVMVMMMRATMMMMRATMMIMMMMKRRIEIAQACDLLVFGQTQV